MLFARHRDRLWAVALRTMGNPEDAADGLQDGLVAAYRRAGLVPRRGRGHHLAAPGRRQRLPRPAARGQGRGGPSRCPTTSRSTATAARSRRPRPTPRTRPTLAVDDERRRRCWPRWPRCRPSSARRWCWSTWRATRSPRWPRCSDCAVGHGEVALLARPGPARGAARVLRTGVTADDPRPGEPRPRLVRPIRRGPARPATPAEPDPRPTSSATTARPREEVHAMPDDTTPSLDPRAGGAGTPPARRRPAHRADARPTSRPGSTASCAELAAPAEPTARPPAAPTSALPRRRRRGRHAAGPPRPRWSWAASALGQVAAAVGRRPAAARRPPMGGPAEDAPRGAAPSRVGPDGEQPTPPAPRPRADGAQGRRPTTACRDPVPVRSRRSCPRRPARPSAGSRCRHRSWPGTQRHLGHPTVSCTPGPTGAPGRSCPRRTRGEPGVLVFRPRARRHPGGRPVPVRLRRRGAEHGDPPAP